MRRGIPRLYRNDKGSLGDDVNHVDVTRAILMALADVHPRGIHADALASLVNCERAALHRPLRLLKETGAIRCANADTVTEASVGGRGEVRITDEAMVMLRPSSERTRL